MSQLSTTVMRWEDFFSCCGSLHSQGLARAGICMPSPALAWLEPHAPAWLSPCFCLPHTSSACSFSSVPSAHSPALLLLPLPLDHPPPYHPSPSPAPSPASPQPSITMQFVGSQQSVELGSLTFMAEFHFKSMVESFNLWQAGAAAGEHY